VKTVGAGGGSIAHVPDLTKALRVGPQSAGAMPGPAAYGRGGEQATVTDANVVLGNLPESLIGGAMTLDREAARRAVQAVADKIGVGLYEAAQGIIDIANENMFGALRMISVQQGYDPRDFALMGFGGAGPMHANAVAALMGSYPAVIPNSPGVANLGCRSRGRVRGNGRARPRPDRRRGRKRGRRHCPLRSRYAVFRPGVRGADAGRD
jgi:N-methylhydantoinase A